MALTYFNVSCWQRETDKVDDEMSGQSTTRTPLRLPSLVIRIPFLAAAMLRLLTDRQFHISALVVDPNNVLEPQGKEIFSEFNLLLSDFYSTLISSLKCRWPLQQRSSKTTTMNSTSSLQSPAPPIPNSAPHHGQMDESY